MVISELEPEALLHVVELASGQSRSDDRPAQLGKSSRCCNATNPTEGRADT
jgi:hypothetical protein